MIAKTQTLVSLLLATCTSVAFSQPISGNRTADFIFVVDESGSMSGEQDFLRAQIPSLEIGLQGVNVSGSRYGLVGFGAGDPEPRSLNVGSGLFGTSEEFQAATDNLQLSGGFEDGYAGIVFALENYTFRPGALPVIVLVTDEDRDILDSAAQETSSTILTRLTTSGATLVSIVDQNFTDSTGQTVAGALVLNSQNRIFVADGLGGVQTVDNGDFGSSFGTTEEDYSQPALTNGGLVADLNTLRAGGLTADSFTEAFLSSLIRTVNINLGLNQLSGSAQFSSFAASFSPLVRGNADIAELFNQLSASGLSFNRRIRVIQGANYLNSSRSTIRGAYSYTFTLNNRFDHLHREALFRQASGQSELNDETSRWSGFSQLVSSSSDFEVTTNNPNGGDSDNWGGLAGVDYALSARARVGVAIGYKDTDETDGDDLFRSTLKGDTTSLNAYGSIMVNPRVLLDGFVSYGQGNLDQVRDLAGPLASSAIDQDIGSVSARLTLPMTWRNLSYGATLQAQYVRVETDEAVESGAGALNLTVPENSQDSFRTILGAYAEQTFLVGGRRLIPRASVEWVHEYLETDDLAAYFSSAGIGSTFLISPDSNSDDHARITVGATYHLGDRTSVYANYLRTLGDSSRTDDVLNIGLNFGF